MSGPFGSSQWMYNSGGAFYPYEIEQSLRFNDNDSAYLSRTPASSGNRKTWTWSGWVKRGNLGTSQWLIGSDTGVHYSWLSIDANASNDTLRLGHVPASGATISWSTQAVFRDPSAWYHILGVVDTTLAAGEDRFRIYVNGVRQSLIDTGFQGGQGYIPQNLDTYINSTNIHNIGRFPRGSNYFDGYLADVHSIDGQALDPTSFGEFKSDIWVPKEYSGSYGTNGFYLPFSDSAAIGDDLSGNGNDWTANNLAATDVMLDSPTNNYVVFNRLATNEVLQEGNTKVVIPTASRTVATTIAFPLAGKYYAEFRLSRMDASAATIGIGPTQPNRTTYGGFTPDEYIYSSSGVKRNNNSAVSYGASYTVNDIIGVAVDIDAGSIAFYKNGASQGVAYTGLDYTDKCFIVGMGGTNVDFIANLGQDSSFAGAVTRQGNVDANGLGDFYYAPPSGYLALCTANLPDPVINPARDDVPADYFNTVLYTGTGASLGVTGVGFQPDLTWIKGRSGATDHGLYDGVRGVQEQLESNQTGAETTESTGLTAFGTDGFTVGALAQLNTSAATYVAWNWRAGKGTASNTDGTITSTVSVNQKAGFSVVGYTGTGANATVGHGLGAAPKLIIVKNRDQADAWQVYHGANTANPETDYLVLNTTAATVDAADRWNDTLPTSSVFSLGNGATVNTSSEDYIAYCFAEVEGFSKFGSYTGNGSADGPFVYCGFRPAFVMVKRTDSAEIWLIEDAAREPYNDGLSNRLLPNTNNSETNDAFPTDLLSNGFKQRTTGAAKNTNGGTYIFAAFAESPFKYSNAR
jgi:hypothetical protein